MVRTAVAALIGILMAPAAPAALAGGTLPGGARWAADVPDSWNGTLLLWSRGYSPRAGEPETAPKETREQLLAAGYALAGSNYGAAGWALEEAVPAQLGTIGAFAARYGEPRRILAWGYSMGGLVSTALAEQDPVRIHGAASFCSSMGGAVGMMNMALDGAYAFRILLAPDSEIRVVDIDDDMANYRRVSAVLASAMKTPEGRARIALAAVLAGIPGWTKPGSPQPADTDHEAQIDQMADAFARGVFLPRVDQEQRAGGTFSWNDGVDYRRQLELSGRKRLVEAAYRQAGLDLGTDLDALDKGARITATPSATAYMMANYTPNARPAVPLLAVQAIGDGLTSPSLQQGYADVANGDLKSLWVRQAGHCNFEPEVVVSALQVLDRRLATGQWPTRPDIFVRYSAAPMLRPCFRDGECR